MAPTRHAAAVRGIGRRAEKARDGDGWPAHGGGTRAEREGMAEVEAEETRAVLLRSAGTGGAAAWNAWRGAHPLAPLDLKGIQLGEADLHEADLHGADLRDANLAGADLRAANLNGADLRGASLERADLRGATLTRARLRRTLLADANLRDVLWDRLAYVRTLPRGLVLPALVAVGILPGYILFSGLRALLQGALLSWDHLFVFLEVFVFFPLGAIFLWYVARFVLMLPFNVYLILAIAVRKIRQKDGCLGIIEAPVLALMILIDAMNPLPFLETFDQVIADDLTHRDAVLAMKVKIAMGYLALVVINLLILVRWSEFASLFRTLEAM
jgi:hypothetical protein